MSWSARQIPVGLALVGTLALMPRAAMAVDGVIEINQARALAGGVTPTDDPGFPVTLDHGGSYRLTGDLTFDGNGGAIDVTGNGPEVMLDLNGFSITQTGTICCMGVYSTGRRLHVRNGSIVGFATAIYASGPADVESMYVSGLGSNGVGIYGGLYSVVSTSTAELFANGIHVLAGSVVRGCTSDQNSSNGIVAEDGSTVVGNNVGANGGYGVQVTTGVTLLDNTIRYSGKVGIYFGGTANGYGRNVLTSNNQGNAQVGGPGGGFQLGTNVCDVAVCP